MRKTLTTFVGLTLITSTATFGALSESIILKLEQPGDSEIYSGVSNIRGWAVSPAGMERAELHVDGTYKRDIPMGGGRADVCNHPSYPEETYPGSCNSGFSTTFSYSNLSTGEHTVKVVAYDQEGDYNEASSVFEVRRFADPFLSDPASIDLTSASALEILDGNTLLATGILIDGEPVDVTLRWRTGSQDFDIQDIQYQQQATTGYNFESLNGNAFLDGQDGWIDHPGQGEAWVTTDVSPANGSKVAEHVRTTATSESAYLNRENDQNYSFPSISSTQSTLVMQFDATGDFQAHFGLGHDINDNDILEADPLGNGSSSEISFVFGVDDRRFVIQQAGLGAVYYATFTSGNDVEDWYRIRLVVNLDANGGAGTGTLSYMNLSRGDTAFNNVSGLTNIGLGLDAMHQDAGPDEWNRMWLHLLSGGGKSPAVDNLAPNMGGN